MQRFFTRSCSTTTATILRHFSSSMPKTLSSSSLPSKDVKNYTIAADLTWYNNKFERNIHVEVKDGKIHKVSPASSSSSTLIPCKSQALIPGFINCHSHAFQRGLRGKGESYPKNQKSSFWTWREEMYKLVDSMDQESFYNLCRQTFEEMRNVGITSVGEFHYFHHGKRQEEFQYDRLVLKAASEVGIRIVLLNVFYQYGGFNNIPLNDSQKRFETSSVEQYFNNMDKLSAELSGDKTQSLGVVAHSLRAVSTESLVTLHQESVKRNMPFHMHIEEQPAEVSACQEAHGKRPMQVVLENLSVDSKFTIVHGTWTTPADMQSFVKAGGNVCICPLTEGNLGDGFPPLESCGSSSICLGTDCNARIDFIEEMRWLEYAHRLKENRRGVAAAAATESDVAKVLFNYGTKQGARSLNIDAGEIRAGLDADFALVDLSHPSLRGWNEEELMASLIFGTSGDGVIDSTAVNGVWRLTNSDSSNNKKRKVDTIGCKEEAAARNIADGDSGDDVVALAAHFINIKSLSGSEVPMSTALKAWLEPRGWVVTLQPVPPQADICESITERFNVFAHRPGITNPSYIFNTHIDTVPPFFPARLDDQNLYGRGSCDTKSLIAAQLLAAQSLVTTHGMDDIGLLYVVSEETDHSGMKKANDLNLRPKAMVVAEPTDMKLIRLQKGILKVKLNRKGVAAHSGYPHLGESAIDPLIETLHDLLNTTWPSSAELGDTTLNVGTISGGQAANALAESASAFLMFRVTEDPVQLLEQVRSVVAGRVEVDLFSMNAPVHLGQLPGFEAGIAAFNTDIPYFDFSKSSGGGTAYLIGPGNITDAHCEREFIPLKQLRESVQVYQDLMLTIRDQNS